MDLKGVRWEGDVDWFKLDRRYRDR